MESVWLWLGLWVFLVYFVFTESSEQESLLEPKVQSLVSYVKVEEYGAEKTFH